VNRKKPGPKGYLRNPYPAEQWVSDSEGRDVFLGPTAATIATHELHVHESDLRAFFRKHNKELVAQPGERLSSAVLRITKLAADALTDTNALLWSGRGRAEEVENLDQRRPSVPWGRGGSRRHVGPEPPQKAEDKCLWLDTSRMPAVMKRYDRPSQSWLNSGEVDSSIAADKAKAVAFLFLWGQSFSSHLRTSWRALPLGLREPISRMLRGGMGRAGRSGRPAYLACATLGVLLDAAPEKIADLLNNYRRTRRHHLKG